MRLTVLTPDAPYPPLDGGAWDTWSRLKALGRIGISVQLVYWVRSETRVPSALSAAAASVVTVQERRWRRWWRALVVPPRALRYELTGARRHSVMGDVRAFAPDAVLLDSWGPALAAFDISSVASVPLVYRSHNVEHSYLHEQAKRSNGMKRFRTAVNALAMGRFEAQLRGRACVVLDICQEDAEAWLNTGHRGKSVVLPPSFDPSAVQEGPARGLYDTDVLFLGNLWAPNNVEGVLWFLGEVLPHIRLRIAPRVVIAGAKPSQEVRRACLVAHVDCVDNPEDTASLRHRARVLVNPVRSGSGVNVKMLEMLAEPAPIVSTTAGVRGLPRPLRDFVRVADDAEGFARSCILALSDPTAPDAELRWAALQESCGDDVLKGVMDVVAESVQGARSGGGEGQDSPRAASATLSQWPWVSRRPKPPGAST